MSQLRAGETELVENTPDVAGLPLRRVHPSVELPISAEDLTMRRPRAIPLVSLSLILLVLASACGSLDDVRSSISERADESLGDRLVDRTENSISEKLGDVRDSDLSVLSSETVTLQQLQDAGIPVGSYQIECDQPLHLVVMEGVFDRDSLFETGATLAGGHAEGMAMKMVARIYDPETEMPLGMIGDQDGGRLNNISESGSMPSGGGNAALTFSADESQESGALVPEAVCQ
ncbi:MAG: hypothetical protein ACOC9Y_06960 [Chloroflexota bacterium]